MHVEALAAACFAFFTAVIASPLPKGEDLNSILRTTTIYFPASVSDLVVSNAAWAIELTPKNYPTGYQNFNPSNGIDDKVIGAVVNNFGIHAMLKSIGPDTKVGFVEGEKFYGDYCPKTYTCGDGKARKVAA